MQGLREGLHQELHSDKAHVTSLDYPTLEAPQGDFLHFSGAQQ